MNKEDIRKMENSELLANLFITRDNLISIRRTMDDHKVTEETLRELFDLERDKYDLLTSEVFRRMEHGKK